MVAAALQAPPGLFRLPVFHAHRDHEPRVADLGRTSGALENRVRTRRSDRRRGGGALIAPRELRADSGTPRPAAPGADSALLHPDRRDCDPSLAGVGRRHQPEAARDRGGRRPAPALPPHQLGLAALHGATALAAKTRSGGFGRTASSSLPARSGPPRLNAAWAHIAPSLDPPHPQRRPSQRVTAWR